MSLALSTVFLVAALLLVLAGMERAAAGRQQSMASRLGWNDEQGSGRLGGGPQRWLRRLAASLPSAWLAADRERLRRADVCVEPEVLLFCRLLGATICTLLSVGSCLALSIGGASVLAAVAAGSLLAGFHLVEAWLDARWRASASLLRRDWPDFLARLRLSLLAGLSLERGLEAMLASGEAGPGGVIHGQLVSVVREIRTGVGCEAALANWADRTRAEEVAALAWAAERARALGLPLSAGLGRLASLSRGRARQAYLAWLNGLPGRLSLYAMIFFLPAILVVVLLPSVLSFIRSGW